MSVVTEAVTETVMTAPYGDQGGAQNAEGVEASGARLLSLPSAMAAPYGVGEGAQATDIYEAVAKTIVSAISDPVETPVEAPAKPLCCTCVSCGVRDCEGTLEYEYINDPSKGPSESVRYCGPCAVKQWECPIAFHFHMGIPAAVRERLLTPTMLHRLSWWFKGTRAFPVHIFHRRQAETLGWDFVWQARGDEGTRPRNRYSYRGWCGYDGIVLLWDRTETLDSLEWLLYHELAHHACSASKMIDEAMSEENRTEGRTTYEWEDDAGHEADSEERLVNRVATAYMGGKEFARPWWRPRVIAAQADEDTLPDLHADPSTPEGAKAALLVASRPQLLAIPGVRLNHARENNA